MPSTSPHTSSACAAAPHMAIAALICLGTLAAVMFIAMLVGVEPHPPGIRGPYLGAMMGLTLASLTLLKVGHPLGRWAGLLTALAFVPAVGPHKFFTEEAAQALAPLILVGTMAVIAAIASLLKHTATSSFGSPSP